MSLDGRLPCGCTDVSHAAGLPCLSVLDPRDGFPRAASADPYRSAAPPFDRDRIDARRLINTDATARAFRDSVAHVYLSGSLTVAELRILFTMGLEHGMALETNPARAYATAAAGYAMAAQGVGRV